MKAASEHEIQSAFFDLVRTHYPRTKLIYAVPNAAKRGPALAAWMKREGMTSGIPDVNIDIPNKLFCGMRIEFKSATGKLTNEQAEAIHQLNGQGYAVVVCKDAQEAFNILQDYLKTAKVKP